jgi:hypothetical protein
LEHNLIRGGIAELAAHQPNSPAARRINRIANTCENNMSFVTTTCVAGRIGEHGGYVGFRA